MTQEITLQRYQPRKRRSFFKPFATPLLANQRGKYGSVTATYNGRVYHSRKEALYAAELDVLKRATLRKDRVVSWTPQVSIPLVVNGKTVCTIIPDFEVCFADGRIEIHEVKSDATMTPVWWVKWKLLKALHPDRIFKVIK